MGVLLLVACSRTGDSVLEENGVPVQFSLLLGDVAPTTKTTDAMAQAGDNWTFRGISNTVFLPYEDSGPVQSGSSRLGYCDPLGTISSYNANNSVFYEKKWLPRDTRSFLFYGSAPSTSTDKMEAGSLLYDGLDGKNTELINFRPEVIAQGSPSGTVASAIANYLTRIANCSVSQMSYVQTFAGEYSNEYAQFTNGGKLMCGSSEGIRNLLTVTYNAINKKGNSDLKSAILNAIKSSGVSFVDSSTGIVLPDEWSHFPADGVPVGTAALRWNGDKFVIGDDTSVRLVPIDRFCYPLPLWYYANSGIRTTTKEDLNTSVYQSGTASWEEDILTLYEENPGRVTPETTGAALINPIQYAVGHVAFTLSRLTSSKLPAASGNVDVNNTNFPLTAIILGGQMQQDFNFTPKQNVDEYFIYDNSFGKYVFLSSTQEAKTIRSLVLETLPGRTVYFAVEFKNNSSKAFTGATGYVLPGATFYLVGKLDLANAQANGRDRIFEKGYTTSATLTVNSLANAYTIIPDLRDPQLQIGLTVEVDWDFATPSNKELK